MENGCGLTSSHVSLNKAPQEWKGSLLPFRCEAREEMCGFLLKRRKRGIDSHGSRSADLGTGGGRAPGPPFAAPAFQHRVSAKPRPRTRVSPPPCSCPASLSGLFVPFRPFLSWAALPSHGLVPPLSYSRSRLLSFPDVSGFLLAIPPALVRCVVSSSQLGGRGLPWQLGPLGPQLRSYLQAPPTHPLHL